MFGIPVTCKCIPKRNHDSPNFIFFFFPCSPNLGRGRKIIDPNPTMHITVKKRIESRLKYKPKAQWTRNSEVYVD